MPADDARFLANSPDRVALLSELAAGPASPSGLAAENDASRRSVQRHLAELEERGWVESSGGSYRLTVTGELVAEEHAEYVGSLARIDDFAPFFRHLPDRDHAPDPTWLAGAELTVSTDEEPHAPVHHYVRSVEAFDADRVRMLSPILSRLFHDAHASLGLRGVHTELVMPARMVERARERNPIEFDVVTATDVLSLHRYPDSFGIGLTLGDERVLMGAYDDERRLRALVDADEPRFHAWASNLFDRYRERCG